MWRCKNNADNTHLVAGDGRRPSNPYIALIVSVGRSFGAFTPKALFGMSGLMWFAVYYPPGIGWKHFAHQIPFHHANPLPHQSHSPTHSVRHRGKFIRFSAR
jgi:hypothetical protein